MDSIFQFNKPVTGKQFFGRDVELRTFSNLLAQGENVVIYEPPKTGRKSLIRQGFLLMKSNGQEFQPVEVNLMAVRTLSDLALQLASEVLCSAGDGPSDYAKLAGELLAGTHLVFDPARYDASGEIISASWSLDDDDLRAAFLLPYRLGRRTGLRRIVVLDEFQNVMLTEDGERVCQLLEEIFKDLPEDLAGGATFVFLGSQVNAMHEIFGVKRYFWRRVERVRLAPIDIKLVADHVMRGFLAMGKVAEQDRVKNICRILRCNIWYVNHFGFICDSLTRGYVTEQMLNEALECLVIIHEAAFLSTMSDLTNFQISLLRAILDGQTRFSSAEVIQQYGLNSSANVRRLKDALTKKEIVSFEEDDKPVILDPLFEYWVRTYYFKMTL
ncbi:MAG: hypothetical protein K6E35_00440 [Bacteroidales bacterium]|nr:hypothetical protein [Bacteroidales bacterium]